MSAPTRPRVHPLTRAERLDMLVGRAHLAARTRPDPRVAVLVEELHRANALIEELAHELRSLARHDCPEV